MLKKITKSQLYAKLRKGEAVSVWLCPSKCYPNPGHPFNCAMLKHFAPIDLVGLEVDRVINSFSYYNLNSELGNRIHYYEVKK